MEEESKIKEYSKYKLKDLILGLVSLVLLSIIIPLNKLNPFGVINSISDSDLWIKIILVVIVLFLLFLFVIQTLYLILYIKGKKLNNFLNEFIPRSYIVPLFISLLLVLSIFFSVNTIEGSSMSPTYESSDKVLTVNLINYEKDDVIIIDTGSKYIIKRIVAKSGDTITVTTSGDVIINSEYIVDSRQDNVRTYSYIQYDNYTLKDNEYYCLGDNRNNSTDSRCYGIFNRSDIYGKVIYKF